MTIKLKKIDPQIASDLLEERPRGLTKVFVRSYGAQGYWGRGWSVQTALRNAAWITSRQVVFVFLCNDETYWRSVEATVNGKHGTIYRGTVTAGGDVRITHQVDS